MCRGSGTATGENSCYGLNGCRMATFRVPYGKQYLEFALPRGEWLAPRDAPLADDPSQASGEAIDQALERALHGVPVPCSVAIAINDKTRPAPHGVLLPALVERLERHGFAPQQITFLIATGTHSRMAPEEFGAVVPAEILARYPVACHDADDPAGLVWLGTTSRGTPVWINKRFAEAGLRVAVGNIEPHQFMGFSGGVKSVAIGLAGRETIGRNHAWMLDPRAAAGRYEDNPARQDVEEIGAKVGVHFVLNAVVNERQQIVRVLAGDPLTVMKRGIPIVQEIYRVRIPAPFDLVIASPGGHPKDINLYQSQKALAHAAAGTKDGGTVILVAACPEGAGSRAYDEWMEGMASHAQVLERFRQEGCRLGPHKAFQIARDAARLRVLMVTQMPPHAVRRLLLTPCATLDAAIQAACSGLPAAARIGVMPAANATLLCLDSAPGSP